MTPDESATVAEGAAQGHGDVLASSSRLEGGAISSGTHKRIPVTPEEQAEIAAEYDAELARARARRDA